MSTEKTTQTFAHDVVVGDILTFDRFGLEVTEIVCNTAEETITFHTELVKEEKYPETMNASTTVGRMTFPRTQPLPVRD